LLSWGTLSLRRVNPVRLDKTRAFWDVYGAPWGEFLHTIKKSFPEALKGGSFPGIIIRGWASRGDPLRFPAKKNGFGFNFQGRGDSISGASYTGTTVWSTAQNFAE